jgi:phosphoribosyl 1,2-cyclic phosphodiesterase
MQNYSIKVVGTGSSGNCYLLTVNDQTLVIEAGINFTKVKKALNFDLSKVVGVLVSHEHGDHADFIKDFVKFGKKVYCTEGTGKYNKIEYLKPFEIGLFKITPFEIFHDAKEPCGFLIEVEGKRLAFITDTNDLKYKLKDIDYWLIEANYSSEKLKHSRLDASLKKRIQQSHMSIDRCKTILEAHNAEKSSLVLLIHGSEKHSDKEEFLNKIPFAEIAENGKSYLLG